jgi:hypothetical protein
MSVEQFKFISPGVFLNEIDESTIPALPARMGPLIIGRFQKGPGMRPVKVDSYREFVSIFGNASPGNAVSDVWRTGEMTAPTYAGYAVQAWLRNNSPCTVYRLLGENRSDAGSQTTAKAGWKTTNAFGASAGGDVENHGGGYGLFIIPNPDSYVGAGVKARATITVDDAGSILTGGTISVITTALDTVTITGHANTNAMADTTGESLLGTFSADDTASGGATNNATQATAIAATLTLHDDLTATASGAVVTITQNTLGTAGNTTVSVSSGDMVTGTTIVSFLEGAATSAPHVTGTLAAVWYVNAGAVVLTGTARDGEERQGAGVMIKGTSGQFTAKVLSAGYGATATVEKDSTFNFNRDSNLFIRKVFNTNPTETNSTIISSPKGYWLGETFESNLAANENGLLKVTGSAPTGTDQLGFILALDGSDTESGIVYGNRIQPARAAQTGWFISQDARGVTTASFDPITDTETLFKFHALDSGDHANRDYKISIQDIKVPTDNFNKYGAFTVLVRSAYDSDNVPEILERFSNCNLNPNSLRYLARQIGDKHYTFNSTNKTLVEHGNYEVRSKYIRAEMSPLVNNGEATSFNPYGVYGPAVPKTFRILSGSQAGTVKTNTGGDLATYVAGSGSGRSLPDGSLTDGHVSNELLFASGNTTAARLTASIEFPTTRMRVSSSEGDLVLSSKAYFGYQSSIKDTKRFDWANVEHLRGQPAGHDPTTATTDETDYSWVFTLDDVEEGTDTTHAAWVSGSRAAGRSFTAMSASGDPTTKKPYVLHKGYDKFTSPMFGGFDGLNIKEKDPFRNGESDSDDGLSTNQSETGNYAYYSIKKAIDLTSDKEFIEFDVAAIPGLTNSSLNNALVNSCEERGDALAVIDIAGGYVPSHETTTAESSRIGDINTTVTNIKDMNINSSYGCTFYPWVQVRDTQTDSVLYVPPSVVALGTFSSSQRKSAVWFAPAGFTRGGLTEGSAGLPVLGVRQRLTSTDRDTLYEANINPIASFPAEGIVIFGQKTLQVTLSALDRINVRRLLIYVKKEISRMAARILFEQNVQATWDRFKGLVEPFLEGVQAGMGLTDFKVVLDESTTTPDLIDRNVLYAKIFLKPARAIEFIALDFIITRSGASFDD